MRRLGLLLLLLLLALGCATDADKKEWAEFWKDVRGDNMKMRSDLSDTSTAAQRKAVDD